MFGVSSDTGDVLGIAHSCDVPAIEEKVRSVVSHMRGEVSFPFPIYSSKTVQGKPLFQWALEGKLDEIEVPIQNSRVYSMRVESVRTLPANELQKRVFGMIESLPAITDESKAEGRNFRRDEVRGSWKKVFDEKKDSKYLVAKIICVCSSGTYMRTLAEVLAHTLGTCGLALSINRTKVGKYVGIGMWWKKY